MSEKQERRRRRLKRLYDKAARLTVRLSNFAAEVERAGVNCEDCDVYNPEQVQTCITKDPAW